MSEIIFLMPSWRVWLNDRSCRMPLELHLPREIGDFGCVYWLYVALQVSVFVLLACPVAFGSLFFLCCYTGIFIYQTSFKNVASLVELGVHNFLDFKFKEGKNWGHLFRIELVEVFATSKKLSCSLNFLIFLFQQRTLFFQKLFIGWICV